MHVKERWFMNIHGKYSLCFGFLSDRHSMLDREYEVNTLQPPQHS